MLYIGRRLAIGIPAPIWPGRRTSIFSTDDGAGLILINLLLKGHHEVSIRTNVSAVRAGGGVPHHPQLVATVGAADHRSG